MRKRFLILLLGFCLFSFSSCSETGRYTSTSSTSKEPAAPMTALTSVASLSVSASESESTPIILSTARLTEADAKALLAGRRPGAELLALAPTYYADFLFYRTDAEARVCVDALNAATHETIAAEILRDYADFQICAYGGGSKTSDFLPVYLSEREGDILSYPFAVVLKWVNGEIESVFDAAAPIDLPLSADGFSVGESWTKPILDGWRLGYDSVAFGFSAVSGAPSADGRDTLPLTRIDYDAEARALVLTMANTRLSGTPEAIGGGNHFIKAVRSAEQDGCVQITVELTENAGCYSPSLRVYGGNVERPDFHGIMEITFTAGNGMIVPLDR